MQEDKSYWQALGDMLKRWLDDETYVPLQKMQPDLQDEQSKVAFLVSNVLLLANEYLSATVECMVGQRPHAAFACCRPIFETGVTISWCLDDRNDPLPYLMGWLLRTLNKDLEREEKLGPEIGSLSAEELRWYKSGLQRSKQNMKQPPGIRCMLADLSRRTGESCDWQYSAIYSRLCSFSHPSIDISRFFERNGEALQRLQTPPVPKDSGLLLATSLVLVVRPIREHFGLDIHEMLKEYAALPTLRALD